MSGSRMGIRLRFALFGVAAVLVAVGLTTGVSLWLMADDLSRQAEDFQTAKLNMLRELIAARGEEVVVKDGKLVVGNHVVNDNYDIVDKLKAIAGGTATIFMGTTRVSTNVLKEDGTRAIGTELQGPARQAIDRGASYRGETTILGVPYFTAYDPLKDRFGRGIGVLYVGVKKADFFRPFQSLVITSIVVALIVAFLCALFLGRAVSGVMGFVVQMTKTADRISVGEGLDDAIPTTRSDELGELSQAVERLRRSMKSALHRMSA